jgi:glutamate-5-semialdehyde dehydrogenase
MDRIGRAAVEASAVLALAGREQKDAALNAAARALRRQSAELLAANALDMESAGAAGLGTAMLDRLKLDTARVEAMAAGVEQIAALADPKIGRAHV